MNWEIGVALGTVISSIVIPFLSVHAAQVLAERSQQKRSVLELFAKINGDIQDFRNAFFVHHGNRMRAESEPSNESQRRFREELVPQSHETLRNMLSTLCTDYLTVGLLLDSKGEKLGRAIQALTATAKIALEQANLPPLAECQTRLDEYFFAIAAEMKPVWNGVRK